jgi:hypothetical protein
MAVSPGWSTLQTDTISFVKSSRREDIATMSAFAAGRPMEAFSFSGISLATAAFNLPALEVDTKCQRLSY